MTDETICTLSDTEGRSPADIAADFANTFLMHRHRGVISCESYFVIFGNDGYEIDQRSRMEAEEVCRMFKQCDSQFGKSSNGCTWALVLTDHTRALFDEDELHQFVWDTWMLICDELAKNGTHRQ